MYAVEPRLSLPLIIWNDVLNKYHSIVDCMVHCLLNNMDSLTKKYKQKVSDC